jgi:hypothetical protein
MDVSISHCPWYEIHKFKKFSDLNAMIEPTESHLELNITNIN